MAVTLTDYDGEKTTVRLHTAALTAGNFDAQVTLMDALRDAIGQMTLGVLHKTVYANNDLLSNSSATDMGAQREMKWLVSWHDAVTLQKGSTEIGTADTDQLDPNDRAHAHIGDAGIVDDFVDDFEAVVKSLAGNAVVIDEITLVGRML